MLLKSLKVPVKVIFDYADCYTNKTVPVHKEFFCNFCRCVLQFIHMPTEFQGSDTSALLLLSEVLLEYLFRVAFNSLCRSWFLQILNVI